MKVTAVLLLSLVLIDGALIAVHIASARLGSSPFDPAWLVVHPWRIDTDGGYAEIFQYLKYLAVAVLALSFFFLRRHRSGVPLALFALLLLADDAAQLHERVGAALTSRAVWQGVHPVLQAGLGELVGFVLLACAFAWYLLTARRGGADERRMAHRVSWLVALLIFFGAVVDLAAGLFILLEGIDLVEVAGGPVLEVIAAAVLSSGIQGATPYAGAGWLELLRAVSGLLNDPNVAQALTDLRLTKVATTVIEEGGEMVTMSLMVTYLVTVYLGPAHFKRRRWLLAR